ncbi:transcription factor TBF1 [Nematolebias whitei]|uniref:transcription factor TBF1 n=1 Tax=Nematolebias whitei TaxID=451745 RepID=UPI0018974968|nr:transcription factor TBF1 [Nematolebias whitei]
MVTPAYEEINYKKPEPAQEEPEPAQEEPEPAQEEPEPPQQEQLCILLYLPQHPTWKEEEALTDQWLCSQERNSILDQEEPELPQIKEEQDDLEIPQIKEEQKDPDPPQENPKALEMKEEHETESFMVTPFYKERNHRELEPNIDQWFSLNSPEAENQVQEGSRKTDSGFNRDKELKQNKRSSQTRSHGDNLDHPNVKRNP